MKNADMELNEFEKDNYKDLFESSSELVVSVDAEGKIQEANEAVATLVGFSLKAVKKMNIFDDLIFEDDHPRMRRVLRNLTKGIPQIFQVRWTNKKGKIIYLTGASTARFTSNKELVRTRCVLKDRTSEVIANQKALRTEEKYQTLFELASDAIFIEDLATQKFIMVNNEACRISEYSKKELYSLGCPDLTPAVPLKSEKNRVEAIRETGSARWKHFIKTKKGQLIPIEISSTLMEYDGKPVVHSLIKDISERVEAEKQLKEAFEHIDRLSKELRAENLSLKKEISASVTFKEIVYKSQKIGDLLSDVEKVAKTNSTVIVLGETGTGKELIAQSVHNLSDRKNERLITVNCSALPGELIESELFGHKKGSFTGAISDKIGKFQLADKGTLFLDEIGDLPYSLQAKFLRVLQEGEIDPVGTEKPVKVDVRVIVATNKDLQKSMESHEFRPDLYYRLFVFPLILPPLRERREDIPLLVSHFVNEFNKVLGKSISEVNPLTMDLLMNYSWPGNIRELENVIERAVILTNGKTLVIDSPLPSEAKQALRNNMTDNHHALKEIEKTHIISVLERTNWKINGAHGAAHILDLPPSTLRDKMKKLDVQKNKSSLS